MANQHELQFIEAAQDGDPETVRRLVERENVNVDARSHRNARSHRGGTALVYASCRNHKEIVEILLDNDANVNAANNDGDTALIWASEFGYKEIAQLLLDKNADTKMANQWRRTALHYATKYRNFESCGDDTRL